jgi:hypothetical protein
MSKPRDWEEAFNEVIDEKNSLWTVLDNIVTLWEMEASQNEIENAMARGRHMLNIMEPQDK